MKFKKDKSIQYDILPHIIKEYRNEYHERHREDGPAVIYSNGLVEYWQNGELHREDGPALSDHFGYEEYRVRGKPHRENGPAIVFPKNDWKLSIRQQREWYKNGFLHREDGPAVEKYDGEDLYYWNGCQLSKQEFDIIKNAKDN